MPTLTKICDCAVADVNLCKCGRTRMPNVRIRTSLVDGVVKSPQPTTWSMVPRAPHCQKWLASRYCSTSPPSSALSLILTIMNVFFCFWRVFRQSCQLCTCICVIKQFNVVVVDRLHVNIMLMRDVESLKIALMLSRVSQLRLCIRHLSLFHCSLSYVLQLIPLLHHTVSNLLTTFMRLCWKYLHTLSADHGQ